jgi:Fe-S cluster assembly scaffold protein SufB
MNTSAKTFSLPSFPFDHTRVHPLIDRARLHAHLRYTALQSSSYVPDSSWRFSATRSFEWDRFHYQPFSPTTRRYFQPLGNGACIADLEYFCREYPEVAAQYCFNELNDDVRVQPFFTAVEAYWNISVVLFVPKGVHISVPCILPFEPLASGELRVEKIVIIAQEGSSVTIAQESTGAETDEYRLVRTLACYLEPYAQVCFMQEQQPRAGIILERLSFHGAQASNLEIQCVNQGALLYKQWLDIMLRGRGASAEVAGVQVVTGNRTHELFVRQQHSAPHTRSTVCTRAVLSGTARTVYQGIIAANTEAPDTNASQRIHALLLSPHAQAWAMPELEIQTKQVQCAHGSAVGRLDQEQMWYLQSRGISAHDAQRLLLEGFIGDMLNKSRNSDEAALMCKKLVDAILLEEHHV